MTDPRDDSLDRLLRQTLRQTRDAGATPSCLDAETMAAWIDGGLSGTALAAAEAHAATCTRCRALVAVMVRSETVERHPAEVSSSAPEGLRARNWLPWLVPLAAAALVTMAIWIPRRAQQPTPESRIASAPAAEATPQVPLSGAIGERRQTPPQEDALSAAAKEARPANAENARADRSELRRETAPAQEPAAAPPPPRVAPPPPQAASNLPPAMPPPAAETVTGTLPVVTPAPSAGATRAVAQAAPETVIVEFQSPQVLAQTFRTAADRGAAPVGAGTTAAAGRGGAGGRGGGGRGGAAPSAGAVGGIAPADASQPTRWRVLSSGIVERSNPPGAPWERVAIEPAGARVTNGAAPSPLVCWLVGRGGLVFLTNDGRSFTRLMFPETVDLASVRATSAREATVTTTDGRTFVTRDGGETWSRN